MSPPGADLAADRAQALTLTPVSRETGDRLDRFVALLLERQKVTNLVGPATLPHLWTRHIADSLQLLALAPTARAWIDLGSGGGFPGIPIACALAGEPGAMVHLVESTGKKAAFLREVVQELDLPAVVHGERIEGLALPAGTRLDVITARALAPLNVLFGYVALMLKSGAQALLLKGQDVEVELTEAAKYWSIRADLAPSKTSPDGRIVVVRGLSRRKGKK